MLTTTDEERHAAQRFQTKTTFNQILTQAFMLRRVLEGKGKESLKESLGPDYDLMSEKLAVFTDGMGELRVVRPDGQQAPAKPDDGGAAVSIAPPAPAPEPDTRQAKRRLARAATKNGKKK